MYMNMFGAEGRATCGFLGAGLVLHAPCRHVRVAHWHCEDKTHLLNKIRWDKGELFDAINEYIADKPQFGNTAECSQIMSFDTARCSRGDDDCGGIELS